jgi:hypothetical protein
MRSGAHPRGWYFPDTDGVGIEAGRLSTSYGVSENMSKVLLSVLPVSGWAEETLCPNNDSGRPNMRQSTRCHNYANVRLAIARTKAEHADTITTRHYLVMNKRKCLCGACGGVLMPRADIVYRHEPRELLCVPCSEAKGIKWRPSLKWEAAKRRRRAFERA